eukprot:SAG31_NODE_8396_length_1459_cov_1.775735_1_plen_29_part_10
MGKASHGELLDSISQTVVELWLAVTGLQS